MLVFTFSSSVISYTGQSFNVINFVAISIQTFTAIIAYCKGLPTNNHFYYLVYFFAKIFYVSANFLEGIVGPVVDCYEVY